MKIGLTGGIACGKSTVAGRFRDLGVVVLDSDQIAREVVAPGTEGHTAVVDAFGETVLAPDGSLDRNLLRKLVFSSSEKRKQLESIIHPRVRERLLLQATEPRAGYVVLEVPLLVETGMDRLVDRVLVVDCPPDQQLSRLQARDGMDTDQARAILAAQAGREQRLAAADDVIVNDGEINAVYAATDHLHHQYRLLAN